MSSFMIEMAVKSSTIIAIAALVVVFMGRRASAASRHLVWTFGVVGLLILPLAVVALPSWNIPIRRQVTSSQLAADPAVTAIASDAAPSVEAIPASTGAPQTAAVRPFSWLAILPIAYVAGVVFLLGRLGFEHWRTRRILSRSTAVTDGEWTDLFDDCVARFGVRRGVRLVRNREEVMPMTTGILRRAVVIPSIADMWDDNRRRAVILHELAHVVRLDCLTQTLAAAAAALYWPHPGVWLVTRRLRVERELACDDCVLSSGTEPREYASHLLEIAHSLGRSRAPALAIGMARPRQLEGRMMAMLDPTRNRTMPAASRRLLALALSVAIVAPLAGATLVVVPVEAVATGTSHATPPAADVAVAVGQNRATILSGGTWQIRLASDGRSAHLTVSVTPNSTYGTTISLDSVEGLAAMLTGPRGPARYTLKRDAGSFDFEGVIRAGAGGGTFSFTPNAGFGDELVRRGFSRPTALDLGTLAWADIGFAFLDDLNALKYERPTLPQLVNGARHGVTRRYVREMADLGYRVGTIDALVQLRNHGVDAAFVRGMDAQGMKGLSVEALVRARDHGVDPDYSQGMRTAGFAKLSLEDLVTARNHGVDPTYVQGMQAVGFKGLTLDDLVNARNHGVDPDYARNFRELGYRPTLAELIDARNHGVDPAFAMEMASAGYPQLPIADLIRLREHGVNASTVEQLKRRGVDHPPVDRLIQLKDRGASTQDLQIGPHLTASPSLLASLHKVLRDANAALERWLQ